MRCDAERFYQEGDDFLVEREDGVVIKYRIINGFPQHLENWLRLQEKGGAKEMEPVPGRIVDKHLEDEL